MVNGTEKTWEEFDKLKIVDQNYYCSNFIHWGYRLVKVICYDSFFNNFMTKHFFLFTNFMVNMFFVHIKMSFYKFNRQ